MAWGAGFWMVFGPVYKGILVTPSMPGEPAREATRHISSLVEANGLGVIWLLLVPVLLSGLVPLVFCDVGISLSGCSTCRSQRSPAP